MISRLTHFTTRLPKEYKLYIQSVRPIYFNLFSFFKRKQKLKLKIFLKIISFMASKKFTIIRMSVGNHF